MKQSSLHTQKGFTLIELMVSLSLFIIVVIVLVGSLYTVNDASRKVQAMRTVMDNLNFAMEAMSRTIKTSENISCSIGGGAFEAQDCPLSGNGSIVISMNSTLGVRERVEYRWVRGTETVNGKIEKRVAELDTTTGEIIGAPTEWQAITAPEIDIEDLVFYVEGSQKQLQGDFRQPRVVIKLDGVASIIGGTTVPFSIQTYVSQRTPE